MVEPANEGLLAIKPELLAPSALREHFLRLPGAPWTPEIVTDHRADSPPIARPAAVLIPLIAHAKGLRVLLTVRPSHLRVHSGQIAFPGGRVEPFDHDRIATAMREAHEEIGLERNAVEVLGELPSYRTGTGFEVTPVVGLVSQLPALRPDPNEVAEIFMVPLTFLMDPRNHQRRRAGSELGSRTFYAMPWIDEQTRVEYFIWGVTAAILRNLYRFMGSTSHRE